jgi:sterol desaturase/sphingolipid hydroxylase (fatty acid hydroxylase superfamily)
VLAALTELAREVLCFAGLAALAFMPLEHLWPMHASRGQASDGARQVQLRSGFVADILFATLGQLAARAVLALGLGFVLVWLDSVGLRRPLFAFVGERHVRTALELAVGLVVFELAGYAYHRLAHASPWLWRLHAVHHSSERLDWLASFRQHPLELVLMTVVQNAPLALLGLPLATHLAVLLLLRLHTVLVHANLALPAGPWGELIALPRFHHRHHEPNAPTCNYASLFPLVDRLFGTRSSSCC